jgi:LAO/AO transport system kinase
MSPASRDDVDTLAEGVTGGDRRALARAITLVESARPEDRELGATLLERVASAAGGAHRVGVSGTPGVGKSTFIEALGLHLIGAGHRVAVLAVDPSSPRTGGSILGDKTRMERLSRAPEAFIRPSPSGGELGGVARRTREAMLLCEAAGFDVVIVETVGVGQSEAAVADMVDTFALLLQPGSGDELQGVKRGVLELCDVLVINKADGELEEAAKRARKEYQRGLSLLRHGEGVGVHLVSALEERGLDALWTSLSEGHAERRADGRLEERRAAQAERWLWAAVEADLLERFRAHPEVAAALGPLVEEVRAGRTSATSAARALLERFAGA